MQNFEGALDDRAESFLRVGTVAKLVAEHHSNVQIDTVTHQRWRDTLGILREVDTYADDVALSDKEVLHQLEIFSTFSNRYPSLDPTNLGEESHAVMLARVKRILKLGRHIAESQTMSRFIALRIKEGKETAGFLADTATEQVRAQPAFYDDYIPTMESLAVTANLMDSILDGRIDQADGKLAHPANKEYYGALVAHALREARPGAQGLLHLCHERVCTYVG
jgi:hypothetical protein